MPNPTVPAFSRRGFLASAAGAAIAAGSALPGWSFPSERNSFNFALASIELNDGWRFGGPLRNRAALDPDFDDSEFQRVSLPHCVSRLSWQRWQPKSWERVWIYRRRFALPPALRHGRLLLHFDGVMTGVTPVINGRVLEKHLGGYLPVQYEITRLLVKDENLLALLLDARWSNTPPEGSSRGPRSIDYLEPGGLVRPVRLLAVPEIFIREVFAKPQRVLDADRSLELQCSLNAGTAAPRPLRLVARLLRNERELARTDCALKIERPGEHVFQLQFDRLGELRLWSVDAPHLYHLEVALLDRGGRAFQRYRTRIGFRDTRFEVDGFFLNGSRLRLFGLDRHELYPYVGFAMPPRVLRRDAQILRRQLHCNFVRCSHYPQSPSFLDACDELGLMVWEELPGWQYLGDDAWKERAVRDVGAMVRRDRNRPSVVIWGVRINESANDPALYRRTRALAYELDGTRPTSGTMTRRSTQNWYQDVFAFDDYHANPDGSVNIAPPLPGVPYMLAEAVGQFNYRAGRGFDSVYRRGGDAWLERQQALRHAQAHNNGAAHPRLSGVVAWCAFDYGSLINSYQGVKCPGVADIFRIPKLGAAFYLTQGDPRRRPVIEPNFYWDFTAGPPLRPGEPAAIFSNCDRLELYLDGRHAFTLAPDRAQFPHLRHPPFFVRLELRPEARPELRIDGFTGGRRVLSRSFSADTTQDRLVVFADDRELAGDGSDATRLAFFAADKFGALRPSAGGEIRLRIEGPGEIVGDNPFSLAENGAGAVWIRAAAQGAGTVRVVASHSRLGERAVCIQVK